MHVVPSPVTEPDDLRATMPGPAEIERWVLAYLRHAPVSLVVREVNRLIAFAAVSADTRASARGLHSGADTRASARGLHSGASRGPVLDVGCGDGFWWTVRDEKREVYGVDISEREITQAKKHIHAELTDVSRETPFPAVKFGEIIGNCSLEHIPDIDAALSHLRRASLPDGRLLMFVPTPRWAYQGRLQRLLLDRAPRLAMTLSGALNGFFQHWHLYDAKVWTRLLAQNGWRVTATYGLGSSRSEFLFRLFMPPAFGEFLIKKATGRYPSKLGAGVPDSVIGPLVKLVTWAVHDPLVAADSPTAYEYLIVAEAAEQPAR